MCAGLVAIMVLPAFVFAAEVQISLHEQDANRLTAFVYNTETGKLRSVETAKGDPLRQISSYTIRNRRLCASECLLDADEILFQGRLDGSDIVIVRDEYNSMANPVRWLAMLVGHPVQVSTIILFTQRAGVANHQELTRKPASYHWRAQVLR